MFEWTEQKEKEVLRLKTQVGLSYTKIAEHMGTTSNSVKHKIRRLQQAQGLEKYSHPLEKAELILPYLIKLKETKNRELKVLETHSGFGGMTCVYDKFGVVQGYDIVQERLDKCYELCSSFVGFKCDSELEILKLRYDKSKFDIVDVDPYGMPSRYFPHVFGLIDDGFLVLTFPMLGVAQINKLTIKHYEVYWDISLSDKNQYIEKIASKLHEYAYMEKRRIIIEKVIRIDRVYRFVIKVEKAPLTELVGLKINR